MTRHTRPERERLEMAITVTRTGVASVTAALIKLALFASASGAATMATTGDWRQMLRAAGYVALVALLLFGLLAFLAVLAWLGTRNERAEAEEGDNIGRIAPNHWITPADGWTWPEQRDYLIEVRDGRAGFSQRGAQDVGHEAEQFNALLRRMALLGFYETHNAEQFDNRNGGVWTEEGRAMLDALDDAND